MNFKKLLFPGIDFNDLEKLESYRNDKNYSKTPFLIWFTFTPLACKIALIGYYFFSFLISFLIGFFLVPSLFFKMLLYLMAAFYFSQFINYLILINKVNVNTNLYDILLKERPKK
jgi:hypothetical protein